jgi:hypothetical protein
MLWFLELKYKISKFFYKLTGRTHPRDFSKRDPFIYEE